MVFTACHDRGPDTLGAVEGGREEKGQSGGREEGERRERGGREEGERRERGGREEGERRERREEMGGGRRWEEGDEVRHTR